ncbi:hypothetical protein M4I33_13185 [Clostridium sp. LY3-2]|uniref:hypothetical protein n=1 Tax=Clostridium sp. LY3-2 TaxID=2942482 RepID=UPI002153381E|nr:hypothetical protein [Clostridium sp. LY3-2]MCR6515824.1 hypothetical protein [Clostridium sp. LY3-2]
MKDLYIIDWFGEKDGKNVENRVYVISKSWEAAKDKITKVLTRSNITLRRLCLVENKIAYEAE